jgi:hypothetical protein
MRWTGANERTVKNWLSGASGPSGEHLIQLVQQSDAVAEAFLIAAGRQDFVNAKRLISAHGGLAQLLAMVDSLDTDGVSPILDSVLPTTLASGSFGPLNDPLPDPGPDPAASAQRRRLNSRQRWFVQQLINGRRVKAVDLRRQWTVSEKTAKRDIALLRSYGLIQFVGSFKTGGYRLLSR